MAKCKHIPTDKCHADIETKALPEQTYIAHEDAIHNGVFSFVESTEVVVPAGKEDVKLSQVARGSADRHDHKSRGIKAMTAT